VFAKRVFCFLVCIGVALMTAFLHTDWLKRRARPVVVEGQLDFGEVLENPTYSLPVTLFNTSDSEIKIERFVTSCACIGIDPPRIHIPAYSRVTVAAKTDLLLSPPKEGESVLYQDLKISVAALGEEKDSKIADWTIKGRILRALSVSAYEVDFNDVEPGNDVAKTIFVVPNVPLGSLAVKTPDSTSKLDAILSTKDDAGRMALRLTLKPTAASGRFNEQIVLTWAPSGKLDLATTAVKVKGNIASAYFLDPPALLIAPLEVGKSGTDVVTVTHKSGRPFSIKEFEVDSKDTSVTLPESGEGTVRRIRVTQKITAIGDRNTWIRILVVDREGRQEWISFSTMCTGLGNRPV
jgi:hypothetical protein